MSTEDRTNVPPPRLLKAARLDLFIHFNATKQIVNIIHIQISLMTVRYSKCVKCSSNDTCTFFCRFDSIHD